MTDMKLSTIVTIIAVSAALLLGIVDAMKWYDLSAYSNIIAIVMAVIGLIIGVVNIENAESVPFMVSVLVLAIGTAALATIPHIGFALQAIASKLALIFVPAAIVVGGKTAYETMSN